VRDGFLSVVGPLHGVERQGWGSITREGANEVTHTP
jgi:hypothetical protein